MWLSAVRHSGRHGAEWKEEEELTFLLSGDTFLGSHGSVRRGAMARPPRRMELRSGYGNTAYHAYQGIHLIVNSKYGVTESRSYKVRTTILIPSKTVSKPVTTSLMEWQHLGIHIKVLILPAAAEATLRKEEAKKSCSKRKNHNTLISSKPVHKQGS